jgi:FkbM family methyltransferase
LRVSRLPRLDRIPVCGAIILNLGDTNFTMKSDGRDSVLSGAFWNGLESYEGCTLPVFKHLCRQSNVILDIGANTGLFALLAQSANPAAHIVCFEPFPAAASRLRTNLMANSFGHVTVVDAAVSNEPGTHMLYFNAALRLTQGASLHDFDYVTDHVDVDLITLDEFTTANALPPADLLKIDVEGWEPAVLAGATDLISRSTPEIIFELNNPDCFEPMREFVSRTGYMAFRLTDRGLLRDDKLVAGGPKSQNRLLIMPDRLGRLDGLTILERW